MTCFSSTNGAKNLIRKLGQIAVLDIGGRKLKCIASSSILIEEKSIDVAALALRHSVGVWEMDSSELMLSDCDVASRKNMGALMKGIQGTNPTCSMYTDQNFSVVGTDWRLQLLKRICQPARVAHKYSNQQGGETADGVDTPFARNHGWRGAAICRDICPKPGARGLASKTSSPPTELHANQQVEGSS